MRAEQYRAIIEKTLTDQRFKYKTVGELVDRLVQRMQDWEEIAEMGVTIPQASAPVQSLIIQPSQVVTTPKDISERIIPVNAAPVVLSDDEIMAKKTDLCDWLRRVLPPNLVVQPAGFEQPITLQQRVMNSPGSMTFVRVLYMPQGCDPQTDSTQYQMQVTENLPSPEAIIGEITKQANMIYRTQPNKVEPRFMRPPAASLDETMRGALSAATDRMDSAEDLAAWGPLAAPLAAARFGNR